MNTLKKGVVLIIDDKPSNIFVLENLLEGENIQCLNATSGSEGLKILLNQDVDLIILDVQMPDMNGFEVAQILKSNKRTRDIPIVFATAERKEHHYLKMGYDEGAVDYLFKPLDPDIAKAKINVLLKLQLQKKELIEKNRSLQKSALLINNSPDMIGVLDATTGKIEEMNHAVNTTLGYSFDELTGTSILAIITDDDRSRVERLLMDPEEHISFEARFVCKDGSISWVHCKVVSREGKWYFNARDITEIKAAEKLKNYHTAIIKQSGEAVYLLNREGRILSWNRGAERIFGYSEKEALKKDIWSLVPQHEHGAVTSGINAIFQGQDINLMETIKIAKDGRLIDVLFSAQLITEPVFGESSIAITERDITGQKIADEKIRESENRFRDLFQATPYPMWVCDLDSSMFLEVNSAAVSHYGYTRDEFLSKRITDILAPGTSKESSELSARKELNRQAYEEKHVLSDGRIIDVQLTSHLLKYKDFKSSLVIATDVTESKRAEDELKRSKERAERLLTTQEMFIANVSHEIRTPMNAIIGFTSLLERTHMTDIQEEYLGAVRKSADTLLNIINDILDISKIDSGIISFESIPFSIVAQMHTLLSMLDSKARSQSISLRLVLSDSIPTTVLGDPTRLSQIMINLIDNAIKFSTYGEVLIKVDAEIKERDHVSITFEVIDHGIGIPESKLENIFERFIQAYADTTRKYGGTGLGLNIVKSLVELQNGEIKVKSVENAGTTFRVTLPFGIGHDLKPVKKSGITITSDLLNKECKILLVEDNFMNQKLASAVLKEAGLELMIAENGLQAIEKVRQFPFDIILMDLQMPELDGYAATKIIRREISKTIPIIAMTANALPGEKEKCLAHGMNDYISKPFSREDLYKAILTYQPKNNIHDETLIDLDYLRNISGNGNVFILEMLETFLIDSPASMEKLKSCIELADHKGIQREAHTLKSMFAFIGCAKLAKECEDLEIKVEGKAKKVQLSDSFSMIEKTYHAVVSQVKLQMNTL